MVISFKHPNARSQLLEHGIVYSARKEKRKKVGKDWANAGRLQPKLCDVYITEMGEKTILELKPYVAKSGFMTLDTWYLAIMGFIPKTSMTDKIWLYKVEKLDPKP